VARTGDGYHLGLRQRFLVLADAIFRDDAVVAAAGLQGPVGGAPGSVKLAPGTKRLPVVDRAALAALNLP
jgi:hypothetical protein